MCEAGRYSGARQMPSFLCCDGRCNSPFAKPKTRQQGKKEDWEDACRQKEEIVVGKNGPEFSAFALATVRDIRKFC